MKDPEIRAILHQTELLKFNTDSSYLIVEEMGLPVAGARVDIAVIGDALRGYEIKGASDTLKRLPNQLAAYALVFDYVTVVTEPKYLTKIAALAPEWVGLTACYEVGQKELISVVRPAQLNKNKNGFHVAKLLWKCELFEVLAEHNIKFWKSDRCWTMCEILAKNLPVDTITKAVIQKLKARTTWREAA